MASNHKTLVTRNGYHQRDDNLTITHGESALAITITPGQVYGAGVSTTLTSEQARDLADTLQKFAKTIDKEA